MPARALARNEAPPSPTVPDTEQVKLDVDGRSWLVRVRGRSVGGGVARIPMMLLGFWPEESKVAEPEREALVVGRTLEAFTVHDLERAFAGSRTPSPVVARPAAAKGRRGRRGGATHRRDR